MIKLKDKPDSLSTLRSRIGKTPLRRIALQRFRRRTLGSTAKALFEDREFTSRHKHPAGLRIKVETGIRERVEDTEVFEIHPVTRETFHKVLTMTASECADKQAIFEIYVEDERVFGLDTWSGATANYRDAAIVQQLPPPAGVVEESDGASQEVEVAPNPIAGLFLIAVGLFVLVPGFPIVALLLLISKEARQFFLSLPRRLREFVFGASYQWRLKETSDFWRVSMSGAKEVHLNPRDLVLVVGLPTAWEKPIGPAQNLLAVTRFEVHEVPTLHKDTKALAAYLQSRPR